MTSCLIHHRRLRIYLWIDCCYSVPSSAWQVLHMCCNQKRTVKTIRSIIEKMKKNRRVQLVPVMPRMFIVPNTRTVQYRLISD